MSDKKHIDRVFQEKLKDFEMTPDPKVWAQIQNKLENEKETNQKQYPIWFRIAGIAAALILLLTIGGLVFNSLNTSTETKTVDTENNSPIPLNTNSNDLRNVVDTNNNSSSEKEKDETGIDELNTTNLNSNSTITENSTETDNKASESNSTNGKTLITNTDSSLVNRTNSNSTSSDLDNLKTSNPKGSNANNDGVASNSENNNAIKTNTNADSNTDALKLKKKAPLTQTNGLANSDKNTNRNNDSQPNVEDYNVDKTSKSTQNQDAIAIASNSDSDSNKRNTVQEKSDYNSNTPSNTIKKASISNSKNETGIALNSDKTTPVKEDANNKSNTPTLNNKSAASNSNTVKTTVAEENSDGNSNTPTINDKSNSLNRNTETGLATYQDRNKKQSNENEKPAPELDYNKVDELINAIKESNGLVLSREEDQPNTEEVTKEEATEKEKDSTSIEDAIAQAENILEKEEKVNRWQLYTNVAPVYYNTLGKGSHIHEEFVNNPKSGEVNTSYGINVGYALNDKLTVRTGFHSLNLSYDTNNAILYENVNTTPTTNSLRNINLAPTVGGGSTTLSVLSSDNVSSQQLSALGANFNAAISQRISYFEVPLELQYRIVNNRFGVNITGGVSTFILDDNEVYSEFEDRKTLIGEANNITSVSFSGNLGLGIDYKFTEKLKFNLEPTFKYQLNAYKETSGEFRPYIIGVYTGLSYKF